jgi:6,7-dimethyl-8-ribityllumazine synthase
MPILGDAAKLAKWSEGRRHVHIPLPALLQNFSGANVPCAIATPRYGPRSQMATSLPSRPRQAGPRRSIGIVASQYHPAFITGLVEHVRAEIEAIAPGTDAQVWEVPGAFEIPLVVAQIARRPEIDAVIALGVIIEGQTAHAALVGRAVTEALMRVMLDTGVPVIHEVLLLQNEDQAHTRCVEDELNRGTEAARVAMQMAQVMGQFPRH